MKNTAFYSLIRYSTKGMEKPLPSRIGKIETGFEARAAHAALKAFDETGASTLYETLILMACYARAAREVGEHALTHCVGPHGYLAAMWTGQFQNWCLEQINALLKAVKDDRHPTRDMRAERYETLGLKYFILTGKDFSR